MSLKKKVINGAVWTIAGNSFSQILRLAGNLILTRLLFPEAFGLMALVQVFLVGITMFSDIGINASIIQNKRSDKKFLNTAWTLQVIRGVVIWLLVCAIAWPAAAFYNQDILINLLIVGGLSSVIMGFQSTKIIIANRNLQFKKLTITEIISAIVGMAFMVVGAWLTQSVWALVLGGLVQSIVKVGMSYYYLKGANNYFCWDMAAVKSMYKFGRWLMLSSILTFLAAQSDRLIIGRLFDVGFLGIYSIAIALVAAVYMFTQKLGSAVFFPSYSVIARDRPQDLYKALQKSRLSQVAMIWPIAIVLVFWGQELIELLYDERYYNAGWMLEIIALGMLVGIIRSSYTGVFMALGKSGVITITLVIQIIVSLSGMMIGNYYGGAVGVIYSLSVVNLILYPVDMFFYYRCKLWQPEIDIPLLAMTLLAAYIYFI